MSEHEFLESAGLSRTESPEDAKAIRTGWILGAIIAVITFFIAILGEFNESVGNLTGADLYSLIDFVIIAGLTYGIYRRNRFAALAMFIYYVASKVIGIIETGSIRGIVMTVVIGYYFLQATLAAFRVHNNNPKEEVIR